MITKQILVFLITTLLITMALACSGGEMEQNQVTYSRLKDVPNSAWEQLSKKKIYFGHQSVGLNIIDGIKDLMEEYPQIKLNIVETKDPDGITGGVFAHCKIGLNKDVQSKMNDFRKLMKNGWGNQADIAFMKFCFVDVKAKTDVPKIFEQYKNEMAALKSNFPKTAFIHFTVPLTYHKTTWKTWLKKLFRKKGIWEYDDNIKRNEINQLIRQTYNGTDPVFDLAHVESTLPDGTQSTFKMAGQTYNQMVPSYTYDDGHLNEQGRKRVAAEFLVVLVNEMLKLTP